MSGAKLTSVKDTTSFLVQQMSAEDRLSIVTFESTVRTTIVLSLCAKPSYLQLPSASTLLQRYCSKTRSSKLQQVP